MSENSTDAYGRKNESWWNKHMDWVFNRRTRVYEKFFSGYQQMYTDRADGKRKAFTRVYIGTIYRQELSRHARIIIRIVYAALFFVATCLYASALCLPATSNIRGWVMLTVFLNLVFYARIMFALYAYLPAKQDYREYEYWQGARIIPKATKTAAYLTTVPILASLMLFFLEPGSYSALELIRIMLIIIAGALIFLIGVFESRIRYTATPPNDS